MFGTFLGDGHSFLNTNGRTRRSDASTGASGRERVRLRRSSLDCLEAVTGVRGDAQTTIVRHVGVYLFSLQWARVCSPSSASDIEKHLPSAYMCGNPLLPQGLPRRPRSTATAIAEAVRPDLLPQHVATARRAVRSALLPARRQLPELSSSRQPTAGGLVGDKRPIAACPSYRARLNATHTQTTRELQYLVVKKLETPRARRRCSRLRHRGRVPNAQLHRRTTRSSTTRSARPASSPASASRR